MELKRLIDRNKFGPWALVTGASSGIGEGFARRLAQEGFQLILVARRMTEMEHLAMDLASKYNTQCQLIQADLSLETGIEEVLAQTNGLEIGLLISNAGTGSVSRFFDRSPADMKSLIQLNAVSHLSLAWHFGKRMAVQRRGGILLTGAMGAIQGVPYMANEAGTKGYIEGLGKSLHSELKEFGIHVTVLVTTPTETPVFYKLGFTLENSPLSPVTVQQCVKESLAALSLNKVMVMPGLKFRVMNALTPPSLARKMSGKILKKNNNIK
jgi:short-subunit dehydrogenase